MKYEYDNSFKRDAKKAPSIILSQLPLIIKSISSASSIFEISQAKKLKGFKNIYRIKIDDYRLGIYTDQDTVIFSRLLPRKNIYKKFP
ncbi:type II toxin-antitoxin system RelE family toxin [Pedobacter mucosus]|uniref:type II toxin-antitoxin system RelE family toxin n=1 Tax=Pedobacter mucosus TaxID=2895286 RepID=UPI001EE46CF6|nr:hypothetical protein [Pedobacter mucosus]UKT64810.1 hypothetical protein LOK61_03330 [Pedobacter mucosus]